LISGGSGAGKTYLTMLIICRSTLEGVRHCIIDPENEYEPCTLSMGGISLKIAPNSDYMLNPFDIDKEVELDKHGNPTGREFVNIKGKCSELLDLLGIMFPVMMNPVTMADISGVLMNLYSSFGFTEDINSLYVEGNSFNPETGEYFKEKNFKVMPTMSDFRNLLLSTAMETNSQTLLDFANSLKLYCKGGIYDLFDCYTNVNSSGFDSFPIVRFDTSGIEDKTLRPIGMHVVLSWVWNKFIKKDIKTRKRIVADEAWMLLNRAMAGSEYTAHFLENCSRRVRKYNGSLCCASQNFREFVSRDEGQAILSNSAVKIYLKMEAEDIEAVGDRFIMSDGEKSFLLSATRGDILIKVAKESITAKVYAFPFEHELIAKEE